MNTVDVLVKAKQLIQDPANWIQGDYTKMVDGRQCFCSLGAIVNVCQISHWNSDEHPAAKLLYQAVEGDVLLGHNFAQYNDTRTHKQVMEAFDKAIELAKAA